MRKKNSQIGSHWGSLHLRTLFMNWNQLHEITLGSQPPQQRKKRSQNTNVSFPFRRLCLAEQIDGTRRQNHWKPEVAYIVKCVPLEQFLKSHFYGGVLCTSVKITQKNPFSIIIVKNICTYKKNFNFVLLFHFPGFDTFLRNQSQELEL